MFPMSEGVVEFHVKIAAMHQGGNSAVHRIAVVGAGIADTRSLCGTTA